MERRPQRNNANATLSDEARNSLRLLVDEIGEYKAADRLGVGRSTVPRALAGLGMHRSSVTAITARLDVLAAEKNRVA